MTTEVIDRLTLSRETLYAWKAMPMPAGNPSDLLRMITEEMMVLTSLQQHTEIAGSISLLLEEYEALAQLIRRQLH